VSIENRYPALANKVAEAREAGYQDEEIESYLAEREQAALEEGYKQEDVDAFLGRAENQSTGVLDDVGRMFGMGLNQVAGAFGGAVEQAGKVTSLESIEGAGKWIQDKTDSRTEELSGQLSWEQKQAREKKFTQNEEGERAWGEAWKDPRAYLGLVAESAPATITGIAAGGVLTRAATKVAPWLGRTGAAALGYGAGEGAMAGTMAGKQVVDEIHNTPWETLVQTEEFRKAYHSIEDESMTHEDKMVFARSKLETAAYGEAAGKTGIVTTILSAPTGIAFDRMLRGAGLGKAAKPKATDILKYTAGEGLQEAPQGGSEEYISGTTLQKYADPSINPMDNVLEAAVSEGIAGVAMGAPTGVATHATGRSRYKQVKNRIGQLESEIFSPAGEVNPDVTPDTVSEYLGLTGVSTELWNEAGRPVLSPYARNIEPEAAPESEQPEVTPEAPANDVQKQQAPELSREKLQQRIANIEKTPLKNRTTKQLENLTQYQDQLESMEESNDLSGVQEPGAQAREEMQAVRPQGQEPITRKDGTPYTSEAAARRALASKGLEQTHSPEPMGDGFVLAPITVERTEETEAQRIAGYDQRRSERIARANKATDVAQLENLMAEEESDNDRHHEGYLEVKGAVDKRRNALESQAKTDRQNKAYEAGEWVLAPGGQNAGVTKGAAQQTLRKVQKDSANEYDIKPVQGGFGESYEIAMRKKPTAQPKADAAIEAGQSQRSEYATPDFEEMVKEAARWRGAALNHASSLDKKGKYQVSKRTTKGDLDAYLMRKYGIDETEARDVSNALTQRNVEDDRTADPADYEGEEWQQIGNSVVPRQQDTPPVASDQTAETAQTDLPAERRTFIEGKVSDLGSVEAVDQQYSDDTPVDRYAREYARQAFGVEEPKAQTGITNNPKVKTFEDAKPGDVYTIKIKESGEIVERFAIRGDKPRGAGDNLHDTYEEAVTFREEERKRNEANAEMRRKEDDEQKDREAAEAVERQEYEDADGFTEGMNRLRKGSVLKTLNKKVRTPDGKVVTQKQFIRDRVKAGATLETMRVDKIKPMSRRAFNRATGREQQAHERKVEQGGEKTEYYISNPDVQGALNQITKIEYDYAQYLQSRPGDTSEARPAQETDTDKLEWGDAQAQPETAQSEPQALQNLKESKLSVEMADSIIPLEDVKLTHKPTVKQVFPTTKKSRVAIDNSGDHPNGITNGHMLSFKGKNKVLAGLGVTEETLTQQSWGGEVKFDRVLPPLEEQSRAVPVEPVAVLRERTITDATGTNKLARQVVLRGEAGLDGKPILVAIAEPGYRFLRSEYKDAEFRATSTTKPVQVYSKGELVGLAMPVNAIGVVGQIDKYLSERDKYYRKLDDGLIEAIKRADRSKINQDVDDSFIVEDGIAIVDGLGGEVVTAPVDIPDGAYKRVGNYARLHEVPDMVPEPTQYATVFEVGDTIDDRVRRAREKGTYTVSTENNDGSEGKHEVEGYIFGDFGVTNDKKWGTNRITHVPTGMLVTRYFEKLSYSELQRHAYRLSLVPARYNPEYHRDAAENKAFKEALYPVIQELRNGVENARPFSGELRPEGWPTLAQRMGEKAKPATQESEPAQKQTEVPDELMERAKRPETTTQEEEPAQEPRADQETATNDVEKPETASQIDDFGEKLEGARKFQSRFAESEMSDTDIASQPLSKIWPKSEVDSIEDVQAAAVATVLRDQIPAKPRKGWKVSRWVEQVKTAKEMMEQYQNLGYDALLERMRSFKNGSLTPVADKIEVLSRIPREQWGRVGRVETRANAYTFKGGKEIPAPHTFVQIDGRGKRFDGVTEIDAVAENVKTLLEEEAAGTPGNSQKFEIRTAGGQYFINRKGDSEYRSLVSFDSLKEASDFKKNEAGKLEELWEQVKARDNVKKADVRTKENRPRTGEDYRNGNDVTPEMFTEAFGFRGVQFGNWVKQGKAGRDRQGMLNQAYDALHDLSNILNIPTRAISLNGELGIAFGARGKGAAAAHYEPGNVVINLTKTNGAGSLAHEWFHALDNYFAKKRGGESPMGEGIGNLQQAYRDSNFITHKTKPGYVYKDRPGKPITKERLEEMRKRNPGSAYFKEENWILDPTHKEGVRVEVEESFDELVKALDESPMNQRSQTLDKGKSDGYWSRTLERAARAFENYVLDKMMKGGYHNDFLSNVVNEKGFQRNTERYPYLKESELEPVASAFDNLFATLKTRETEQGVELYSKAPKTNNTPAQVEKEAKAFLGKGFEKMKQAGTLKVVQSLDEAPVGGLKSRNAKAIRVRAYHGGATDPGNFSGNSRRGYVGPVYFTDSPEVANQYAIMGGPDLNYSDADLAEMLFERDETKHRRAMVTPVDLEFNNLLEAKDVTWDDVLDTLDRESIIDQLVDDSSVDRKVENYWQDVLAEGGDWESVEEITAREYLEINLEKYLQEEYDDVSISSIMQDDGDSLHDTSTAFRFLVLSGKLDEFAQKNGFDGVRFNDTEAGGVTYVPFDNKSIKPVFDGALYSKNGDVAGYYKDGQITLVADQIAKGETAGLLKHEGLHLLLRNDPTFKKRKGEIMRQFKNLKNTPKVKEAYAAVPKDTDQNVRDEEALAYLMQNHKEHSLVQRMISAVKAWMFRNGIPVTKLTEGDLTALAAQGIKRFSKAQTIEQALAQADAMVGSEQPVFSRKRTKGTEAQEKAIAAAMKEDGELLEDNGGVVNEEKTEFNFDMRETATSEDVSRTRNLLRERGRRGGTQGTLLGKAITRSLKAKGGVSLLGRKVSQAKDLAALAQVYRNPEYETFRLFFTKGGEIVGQTAVSSRLPGVAPMFAGKPTNENSEQKLQELREQQDNIAADGFWLLHNHPSGNVEESRPDVNATAMFAQNLRGFQGHVIINHNKYSVLSAAAGYGGELAIESRIEHETFTEKDELLTPEKPHPLLGRLVKSPEDVAEAAAELKIEDGYFSLFSHNKAGIRGIMEIPVDAINSPARLAATVRRFARQTGGQDVFAVLPNNAPDALVLLAQKGFAQSFLRDVVNMDGDSLGMNKGIPQSMDKFFGQELKGQTVAEKGGKYSKRKPGPVESRLFDTQEHKAWYSAVQGAFSRGNFSKDKIAEILDNANTAVLDRLNPVKKNLGEHVYRLHRLMGNSHATMQTFLEHGELSWKDQALTVLTKDEGFLPWLERLGDDGPTLFKWMAVRRAATLDRQGRENWLTADQRKALLDELFEGLTPEQRRAKVARFEQLNQEFQKWNKNIIKIAREAGLMSEEQIEAWTSDYYLPFYRIMENEMTGEEFMRAPRKAKQHVSAQIRRLKGGKEKLGDPIENILRNWSHLIQTSQANVARQAAADVAVDIGVAEEVSKAELTNILGTHTTRQWAVRGAGNTRATKTFDDPATAEVYRETMEGRTGRAYEVVEQKNTTVQFGNQRDFSIVSYQDNGETVYLRVNDPDLFEAMSEVNIKAFESTTMKIMGLSKRVLTVGATATAGFRIANLFRDTIHTAMVSKSFIPFLDSAKGLAEVWNKSDAYIELMASGGGFSQGWVDSGDPKAMARAMEKIVKRKGEGSKGIILDTPRKMWEFWERIGHASEMAARVQLYKNLKAKGQSHMDAAFEARDLMDFQRSGASTSVRVLTATVPFLNARFQGLNRMYRGAKADPKAFWVKGAITAGASLMLWSLFKDDERYKELEDWEKFTYHHFWIGSQHFRLPKAFETGALFSTMFEAGADVMSGNEDFGYFVDFLTFTATETFEIGMPQLISPVMEVFSNKSAFTGRDIESMALQRLPSGERAHPWTPEMLKDFGRLTGISPVKAEAIILGYTAAIGGAFLAVGDAMYRHATNATVRPSATINAIPGIGRFVRDDVNRTKYATRYYDFAREVNEVVAVVSNYKRVGEVEMARKLATESMDSYKYKRFVNRVSSQLAKINQLKKIIWADKSMTSKEKRVKMDEIQKAENEIYQKAYRVIYEQEEK